MFTPKRILVPTDFSAHSTQALRLAVDLARQFRARIHLVHVIDRGAQQCITDYCFSTAGMKRIEHECIVTTDENLKKEITLCSGPGDVEIIPILKKGFPEDEIIREQVDRNIELIVMASHGKNAFRKHPLGSVAERVLRSATCPVLLSRRQVSGDPAATDGPHHERKGDSA